MTPVASFFAVTVAPGTTAPVESLTVPVMFDVPVCANAVVQITVNATATDVRMIQLESFTIETSCGKAIAAKQRQVSFRMHS
jgi:hypothetical protein